MHNFDLSLFYILHGLAGRNVFLDSIIIFTGDYLIYGVLLGVAITAFRAWRYGKKEQVWGYGVALVAAFIARYAVASGIRHFYERARPFVTLGTSHLLNDTAYSFPSGHTIFMFALATVVYFYNKTFGWWLFGVGLLIGIARVIGGVHYPSDILGGMVCGILTGAVVLLFWKWLNRFLRIV